jgi:CRISPR system Cascade subunit CasC
MINAFTGKHLEFHILQSFPVSCLNRDDVNAPKTVMVGGTIRARISSQCWKREVRMFLHQFGVRLAVRTKKMGELLNESLLSNGATPEEATAFSTAVAKELSKDTLMFFSLTEAEKIATYAKQIDFDVKNLKVTDKKFISCIKEAKLSHKDGVDLALFGRMVAVQTDFNINGAASFAHAISTHKATTEIEFFTALDDLQTEPGSAHMGTLEFNSATYYRYVSIDLGQLCENLCKEVLPEAVKIFTSALFLAVPSARQNSMSASNTWDYAKIFIRHGQRLQASFDKPVTPEKNGGYLKPSIESLENFLKNKEHQAASLFGKELELSLAPNTDATIDTIIEDLQKKIMEISHNE